MVDSECCSPTWPPWVELTVIFGGELIKFANGGEEPITASVQLSDQFIFSRLIAAHVSDCRNCVLSTLICVEQATVDIVISGYSINAVLITADCVCEEFKPSRRRLKLLLYTSKGNISCDKDGVNVT